MKKIISLITILLIVTSCNREYFAMQQEFVEVSFRAELPDGYKTKADGEEVTALSVNNVVCAVFEDGIEIPTMRSIVAIEDGSDILYSPRLVRGRTYNIVFWAMKDNNYDVTDLTSVSRTIPIDDNQVYEENYDAYTASERIEVINSVIKPIVLRRPVAQFNMGITQEDWNAVASDETFGMTPSRIVIQLNSHSTFNALTGCASEECTDIEYVLPVSGSELIVDQVTYKSIAMCYIFTEYEKENVNITYSIYDQSDNPIRENAVIENIPLQMNYKTNLLGNILTGKVSYIVSLSGFSNGDYTEEI